MKETIALAAISLAVAVPALAQNARGEAKATVAGKSVAIDYGRPSLRGRDMLGKAEVGTPWRLGADAATTLKTDADLDFSGVKVPKGEYTLTATKVDAAKWNLNVLGKGDAKVADIPLASSTLSSHVETFTIELKGEKDKGELSMSWGNLAMKAPFTAR
jgi:Protein of unknown function (DUF2911)